MITTVTHSIVNPRIFKNVAPATEEIDFCDKGIKARVVKLITVKSDTLDKNDPENSWMYLTTMSVMPMGDETVIVCDFYYSNFEPTISPGDVVELHNGERKL